RPRPLWRRGELLRPANDSPPVLRSPERQTDVSAPARRSTRADGANGRGDRFPGGRRNLPGVRTGETGVCLRPADSLHALPAGERQGDLPAVLDGPPATAAPTFLMHPNT